MLALAASVGIAHAAWQLVADARARQADAPPVQADALALQRSVAIYNFRTTAQEGPGRGEEIYYFKCWYCHNAYTVAAGTGAMSLKGLFTRPKLVTTGQPVSDETVAEKIRRGSARMPAYRYALSDADMSDLLSYLRDDRCCFEDEPPRNPSYRVEEP
jgi:mono/diheme cytochrome c family protein